MKCALLIPSWVPEDIFSSKTASSQINYWQPLGTLYVAAVLKKAGHEVIFLNGAFITHEELLGKVTAFRPEFIGIYSTTFGWSKAKKTAADCRQALKEHVFICAGGPYPIAVQEHCLHDAGECIDAVVTGEGEFPALEMVERLQEGKGLDGIRGIAYRQGDGIIKNPPRPLITDLDSLPFPARELLDNSLYIAPLSLEGRKPFASVLATRGCPFNCHFCSLTKMWTGKQRRRSVGNVLDEIEGLYKKHKIKTVSFVDDLFILNKKWVLELCRGMYERKLNRKIIWDCQARVDLITEDLVREMKKAGCKCIDFGIEFGNQRMLDFVRKGFKLEDVYRAVSMVKKTGISVKGSFIMGYPTETKDTLQDTVNFAKKLNLDYPIVSFAAPYPGTDLYNYCLEHNMLQDLEWVDIMQLRFKAIKLEHLDIKDLIEYSNKFMRECMLRPNYIAHMLLKHPKQSLFFGPKVIKKLVLSKIKN